MHLGSSHAYLTVLFILACLAKCKCHVLPPHASHQEHRSICLRRAEQRDLILNSEGFPCIHSVTEGSNAEFIQHIVGFGKIVDQQIQDHKLARLCVFVIVNKCRVKRENQPRNCSPTTSPLVILKM